MRLSSSPAKLLILTFWSAAALVAAAALLPASRDMPMGNNAWHMIAFAVLASLASHAYYRLALVKIGLGLAGFAALIEVLQLLPALGGTASAMDWLAACASIAVVLIVTRLKS